MPATRAVVNPNVAAAWPTSQTETPAIAICAERNTPSSPPSSPNRSTATTFAIGNIALWLFIGYDMIVFYAALRAVPVELTEAAVLDGASRWQIARRIKVPLIMPVISVIVIFSIIGTLQLFTEPQVLRPSAPDVIDRAYVPNMYLYSLASTGQQFNYVLAIAFVMAGVILCLAIAYTAVTRLRRS